MKLLCSTNAQLGFGESQMLDKLLYEEEVRRCVFTFEQQFHYGVFYAYMKLREQVGVDWAGLLRAAWGWLGKGLSHGSLAELGA